MNKNNKRTERQKSAQVIPNSFLGARTRLLSGVLRPWWQAAPAPALTAVFEHTGGPQTSEPTHNIGNGDAVSNQTAAHA